jgi:hypothetical protein
VQIFEGGEMNEKDCFGDFIVGFGFGVGRVPLVAWSSWRWSRGWLRWRRSSLLQSKLRFKMRKLLKGVRIIF